MIRLNIYQIYIFIYINLDLYRIRCRGLFIVFVWMFKSTDDCLIYNHIYWKSLGPCAALLNQRAPLSGSSLLLLFDCVCMSQSLQDIRPLFRLHLSLCSLFHLKTKWRQSPRQSMPDAGGLLRLWVVLNRRWRIFAELGCELVWSDIKMMTAFNQSKQA